MRLIGDIPFVAYGCEDAIRETVPGIWFMLNSMVNRRHLSEGSRGGLVPWVKKMALE